MKCIDCNGSGIYVGLGLYPAETCKRCNGTGHEPSGSVSAGADDSGRPWASITLTEQYATIIINEFFAGKDSFPNAVRLNIEPDVNPSGQTHIFTHFDSPTESQETFYLLIGNRSNNTVIERLPKDMAEAVALDHAQKNHLALYKRRGQDNYFYKVWSA